MMLAGDEVGNSQNGNNNTYCQDNEIGWVDWSALGGDDDLTALVAQLTKLRRQFPQLRPRHWLAGDREGRPVLAPTTDDGTPIFIVLNAASDAIEFVLPEWPGIGQWIGELDTAAFPKPAHAETKPSGTQCISQPSSVMLFSGMP
jgi:glycogen operon protein